MSIYEHDDLRTFNKISCLIRQANTGQRLLSAKRPSRLGVAVLHPTGRSSGLPRRSASLSRPVSSPALITSCLRPFALRLWRHTGLLLLFEVGAKPPHDGMRRMGRCNLWGALATGQRQDRRTLRTHPTRRPREDIFLPEQNALSPCLLACNFPALSAAGSGNRRNGGAVLLPAELATIDPHPVQNHGQAPGDRDDGSTYSAPLSYPHAPRLQPRPFPTLGKH
jgi:hypothetical protein